MGTHLLTAPSWGRSGGYSVYMCMKSNYQREGLWRCWDCWCWAQHGICFIPFSTVIQLVAPFCWGNDNSANLCVGLKKIHNLQHFIMWDVALICTLMPCSTKSYTPVQWKTAEVPGDTCRTTPSGNKTPAQLTDETPLWGIFGLNDDRKVSFILVDLTKLSFRSSFPLTLLTLDTNPVKHVKSSDKMNRTKTTAAKRPQRNENMDDLYAT